jgi:two-component system, cell cycle response regulator DivK
MPDTTVTPTIMVVEDFEDTRKLLRQSLELKGYRVVEAVNGWEAVEIAVREQPDLILMDLNLPILDGFSVVCMIRENDSLENVPIVAVSAYDSADFREDAFDAGCTEYVTKPIDFEKLDDLLGRFVPIQGRKVTT